MVGDISEVLFATKFIINVNYHQVECFGDDADNITPFSNVFSH